MLVFFKKAAPAPHHQNLCYKYDWNGQQRCIRDWQWLRTRTRTACKVVEGHWSIYSISAEVQHGFANKLEGFCPSCDLDTKPYGSG